MINIFTNIKDKFTSKPSIVEPDIKDDCIDFAIWVQDNYSQNVREASRKMLPKGQMRLDFTEQIFTMEEIWNAYKSEKKQIID